MAGHIDRHGQTRHMGGHLLDSKAEAGGLSTEALRPDAQSIDGRQQLPLEGGVVGVRVRNIQRAEKGLFGKIRHLIKAAAHADASRPPMHAR